MKGLGQTIPTYVRAFIQSLMEGSPHPRTQALLSDSVPYQGHAGTSSQHAEGSQARWFKTTEMYSLIEFWGPESEIRVSAGLCSLQGSKEEPWLLLASGHAHQSPGSLGFWQHNHTIISTSTWKSSLCTPVSSTFSPSL